MNVSVCPTCPGEPAAFHPQKRGLNPHPPVGKPLIPTLQWTPTGVCSHGHCCPRPCPVLLQKDGLPAPRPCAGSTPGQPCRGFNPSSEQPNPHTHPRGSLHVRGLGKPVEAPESQSRVSSPGFRRCVAVPTARGPASCPAGLSSFPGLLFGAPSLSLAPDRPRDLRALPHLMNHGEPVLLCGPKPQIRIEATPMHLHPLRGSGPPPHGPFTK